MFLLIDALVAAAILATGLLSLGQLLVLASGATAAAGRATHAALLAAQKVEQLRALRDVAPQGEVSDAPEPGFTRQWSVTPMPADPSHALVIEVVVRNGSSTTRLVAVTYGGFSIIELLIASLITTLVVGAVLALVAPAQNIVRAQGEAADLHQRLRAAADGLASDVRAASSVRPYRIGAVRDDGAAGIYYRHDTISVVAETSRTYYLKPATAQLMQYDGAISDFAVVEHVVDLAFEYFGVGGGGSGLEPIGPGILVDGPWVEDASRRRIDADVLRIREVRATLRLESTATSLRRLVPDEEIVVDIALRNVPEER